MGWGRARRRSAVADLAERRLAEVARQWRCPPGLPDAPDPPADAGAPSRVGWEALVTEPVSDRRPLLPAWSRSAVRGLAGLLAVAVAVSGYWAWTGRPRAVATAPSVLAVGAPLPGASSSGATATAAAPAPDATTPPAPTAPPVATAPAPVASPATALQVVVHVTGLVARPGLVRLPLGARVADAIAEAGGVTRRRAADSVNLARVLADGEQVVVTLAAGAAGAQRASTSGVPAGTPMGPGPGSVDLNMADARALEDLPGVGPVIAARIVAWRVANGAFRSVEELGEVSGIGDAVLAQVRDLVRV